MPLLADAHISSLGYLWNLRLHMIVVTGHCYSRVNSIVGHIQL